MAECIRFTSKDSSKIFVTEGNQTSKMNNAGTQTPEVQRREMVVQNGDITPPENNDSSMLVMRVSDEKGMTKFEKEAKAMAIPDVVVEYIKDTCAMKNDNGISMGNTNPAFEGKEILIRIPSMASLRDDSKSETNSLNNQVHGSSDRSVASEENLLPIGTQNPQFYYSMPRKVDKKHREESYQMHSQPGTPKMQRLNVGNQMGLSPSLMSLFQQQGANIVVPPSPNFGYRPLESETSAVYTIIKTYLDTNDLQEIHFLPAFESERSTPFVKRKFEYTPPPPVVEKTRRRLQTCTDCCSLLFLIPGILLAIITPIFIIPMFLYPMEYFLYFVGSFICSGALSVVILSMAGCIGNTVWHYNDKSKKLRPKLHCGSGPMLHFWGGSFYYGSDDRTKNREMAQDQKEVIV